jgi:transposase-like protein
VKRTYSDEERANAVDLYAKHGPSEAARLTNIPMKTIASWANRDGVQTSAPRVALSANEANRVKWETRRLEEANDAGADAARVREAMVAAALAGAAKQANQLYNVYGVLIDKAQLLSGSATSRTETVDKDEFASFLLGARTALEQKEHL